MAKFTQKAIMSAFLDLLHRMSLDKITVKDIVDECGINRNTFYYYYQDIYDLLEDVFETEYNMVMSQASDEDNFEDACRRATHLILEYKEAIEHMYQSKSREVLLKYLGDVTGHLVKRFVEKRAKELKKPLKADELQHACDFFTSAFFGREVYWLRGGLKKDPEQDIVWMSEIFENSLDAVLESCKRG